MAALEPLPQEAHEPVIRCAAAGVGEQSADALRWLHGEDGPPGEPRGERFLMYLAGVVAGYQLQQDN